MRFLLNKTWSTFAAVVLSASAVNADAAIDLYSMDGYESCCVQPEPCYGYAYNPPVFIADCCGWYGNVEYLYWKANQEGISEGTRSSFFGQSGESPSKLDFVGNITSLYEYPKFEWDTGFRFSLGYHLPCDGWSVGLGFTHYRTDAESALTTVLEPLVRGRGGVGKVIGPAYSIVLLPYNSSIDRFSQTQVQLESFWDLQFNQLDLDFSREYIVAKSMTLRPHMGLRALFINQAYDIKSRASTSLDGTSLPTLEAVTMNNDFKGLGLEGGLDMGFDFGCCGFGFYGELGGSAVFGKARTTQREDASAQSSIPVFYHSQDIQNRLLVNADLAFGFRWRQKVNCNRNMLTLKAGFEEHIFFGYNRFRSLSLPGVQPRSSNNPTGNLDFYGVTFALGFDF